MTFKRGKGALEAKSQDTTVPDGVQAWQMDLDTLNKNASVFTQPLTVLLLVWGNFRVSFPQKLAQIGFFPIQVKIIFNLVWTHPEVHTKINTLLQKTTGVFPYGVFPNKLLG